MKTVQHRTATSGGCSYYLDFGFLCGATLDSTQTYTYSATGNIESISTGFGGGTVGYYGTGNRIQYFGSGYGGGCGYSTDSTGNVTQRACSGDTINFYWAADGRLDSLKRNGVKIAYAYDANGRLVRRDSAGAVRSHFLWDGDHLLAELGSSANSLVAQYAYNGLDDLHAVIISGTPYYAHTDAMGNIRGYTSNGTQYGTYRYDEWGRPVSGAGAFGILERPHWKGALWLEPGPDLYYMRNRWYEPRTGRFLSEDPAGLLGGMNLYQFAGGDPVGGRDPTGLGPCFVIWIVEFCWGGKGDDDSDNDGGRAPLPWHDWCASIGAGLRCLFDRDDDLAGPRQGPQEPQATLLVPERGVVFGGVGTCMVVQLGMCGSLGIYSAPSGKGLYLNYGGFVGADVSVFWTVGKSSSWTAFQWGSVEMCGGPMAFQLCGLGNFDGRAASFSQGLSLIPSFRVGASVTVPTRPVPAVVCGYFIGPTPMCF